MAAAAAAGPALIDHELQVHHAHAVGAVVLDVARPRAALDVDEDAGSRALEVDGDDGAEVALGVLVRVEVAGEAAPRDVLDGPDVLLVRRVLALARHPHRVQLP